MKLSQHNLCIIISTPTNSDINSDFSKEFTFNNEALDCHGDMKYGNLDSSMATNMNSGNVLHIDYEVSDVSRSDYDCTHKSMKYNIYHKLLLKKEVESNVLGII